MTQEKSAEIIDLSASRAAAAGDGAGPFLASARLAAGLDMAEVAAATKIKPEHIEAIEGQDMSRLPATPYAVGFVKVYAAYLGLDADEIAAEFRKEIIAARPAPEPEKQAAAVPAYEASDGVKLASILGILLIGAFAVWILFQIAGNSGNETVVEEEAPRVRVSETRAETPRPRVSTPGEYEVLPIPSVGSAAEEIAPSGGAEDSGGVNIDAADQAASADSAPQPQTDTPPVLGVALGPVAPTDPALEDNAIAAEDRSAASLPASDLTTAQALPPIVEEPVRTAPPVARPEPAAPEPVVVDARLIRSIGPKYPNRCERGAEPLESVAVMFDVNPNGRIANPRVMSSTNSCFEEAAVAAISRWRFDPRTVDGAARTQRGLKATLNFRR